VAAAAVAGVAFGVSLAAIPLVLAVLVLVALGLGIFLAALTVRFRDFRLVVPLFMQFWMFVTPAIYDQSGRTVGPTTERILLANPVQAIVVNFRAALLGTPFDWPGLALAAALGVVLFFLGGRYFRRTERRFADII
jgi:lipopolysaccharide transport system permease protein